MPSVCHTGHIARREALRSAPQLGLNGIDFVRIVEGNRTLEVHCIFPLRAGSLPAQKIFLTARSDDGAPLRVPIRGVTLTDMEQAGGRVLRLALAERGRGSNWTLRIGKDGEPAPEGWDAVLSFVELRFPEGPESPTDCLPGAAPTALAESPAIDYLTGDFDSFRRLMLDRIAALQPELTERNPADVGMMLVDLLAYRADLLSYYQDAVATEMHLGTARRRVSIRRHARLMGHFLHEGNNARSWVCITPPDTSYDDKVIPAGTPLIGHISQAELAALPPTATAAAILEQYPGARVFETLHDLTLHAAHTQISFHLFGEQSLRLPIGTTQATLRNDGQRLRLKPGDILVFVEIADPDTLLPGQGDIQHRCVVRVTQVIEKFDPLFGGVPGTVPGKGLPISEIHWHAEDALTFEMQLACQVDLSGARQESVIAYGNTVLADHGCTMVGLLKPETVPEQISGRSRYRPRLPRPHVVYAEVYDHRQACRQSAQQALRQEPRQALPQIYLHEAMAGDDAERQDWTPQQDLLLSGSGARHFVVEVEEDGHAGLRFGDGVYGISPAPGTTLRAVYRATSGRSGDIGKHHIRFIRPGQGLMRRYSRAPVQKLVPEDPDSYCRLGVSNPLQAMGSAPPEPLEQVRLGVSQCLKKQQRAITEEDFAAILKRHPEVERAAVAMRFTGSRYTYFVAVDRRGDHPIDAAFREQIRVYLEPYRPLAYEIRVSGARYVPLWIDLRIRKSASGQRSEILVALRTALGSGVNVCGVQGLFHPDRYTFGSSVYLSQVVAQAMSVPGVADVQVCKFQRLLQPARDELRTGILRCGAMEIPCLDQLPRARARGLLQIHVEQR